MANRTLELTLISAKDLNNVNSFTKMDVYAIATIAGDHRTQQRTPVNYDGGKNPSWNSTLRFLLPSDLAAGSRIVVHVLLRSQRTLGDRDVGEVHIPLKELLEGLKEGGPKFVSYQVRKPGSGKAKGVLNISYKFLDSPAAPLPPPAGKPAEAVTAYPPPAKQNEPVMAYPAAGPSGSVYPPPYPPSQGGYAPYPPVPQAGYGYGAPPQAGYGYGAPPQAGYGYSVPPQAGYGYGAPPPAAYGYGAVPAKNNKNNFGLGLGAGLLGGALGGMLIGDMVSDSAAYDSGYDAGFDDGFGF